MAAIIRVKRRLDEDPAEGLIIQYKRCKTSSDQTDETQKFCLSLVTTVKSKDAAVTSQVQKVLRHQQRQTNYKSHPSRPTRKTRTEKKAAAKASRYKIVNSRRDLPVDVDDRVTDSSPVKDSPSNKELKNSSDQATDCAENSSSERVSDSSEEVNASTEASPSNSHDSLGASSAAAASSEEPVIQLYDVEQDSSPPQAGGSGITLNGQSLVSQHVPANAESSFVYDLYYINYDCQQYNFRDLENILSIEAMHDELLGESDRHEECEDAYEDEDDSNDESNWRNDYPDRDPDAESDEDRDEHEFGSDPDELDIHLPPSYHPRHDDFLAEAMGTRLHLYGSASEESDDEDDSYSGGHQGRGSYYNSYLRRAGQDLLSEDSD